MTTRPVKDLQASHLVLTKNGLKIPINGLTCQDITPILADFIQNAPSITTTNIELLWAILLALDHATQPRLQENSISHRPQEPDNPSSAFVTKLQAALEKQDSQIKALETVTNDIKATIHISIDNLGRTSESTRSVLQQVDELVKNTNPTQDRPLSYADALRIGTPAQHAEVLAQGEAQSRQIIIRCPSVTLYNMTEKELVAKANLALDLMRDNENTPQPTFKSSAPGR